MGRRKKMVVRRPLLSPRALVGEESRASLAVTVSWMLTLLATAGGMIVAEVCHLLSTSANMTPQQVAVLGQLTSVMIFVAAATGIFCLLLTVVVHRVRRDRPPLAITVTAVFVGCLPLATMLLLALRG